MNRIPGNGQLHPQRFVPVRFDDFETSWAGMNPFQPGFLFGAEDGRLLFTDENFAPLGEPGSGSVSGEAVNGVAYASKWLAVSTRQEVTLLEFFPRMGDKLDRVLIPYGAHGITAAPSGCLVAPLGKAGVMFLPPGAGPGDVVGSLSAQKEGLIFYRVLALPGSDGKDLLVSACRRGGIGATEIRWGEPTYNMGNATFPGLDVVDVCAIGAEPNPRAIAAVGRDGSVILSRDALTDRNPLTVKFDTVRGTAYRLLSRGGNLFLLTSQGMYALMNLASRFVEGASMDSFTTPILVMPMEAVDANLVNDRWLLVVMPDAVHAYDATQIEQSTPADLADGEARVEVLPRVITPHWLFGHQEGKMQLAKAG